MLLVVNWLGMCCVDYNHSVRRNRRPRLLHSSVDIRSVVVVADVWHFRASLWTGRTNFSYCQSLAKECCDFKVIIFASSQAH